MQLHFLSFLLLNLLPDALSFVIYPEAFRQPSQVQIIKYASTKTTKPISYKPLVADGDDDDDDQPLPVIIWHGLGDSYDADGLKQVAELIDELHPGTYVYIIKLGADGGADRSASFFGNVTQQVEDVCTQLQDDVILSTAPAVDAVGFSQGGQFLRGLIETCDAAKVRSLITFGSQHNGISKFQACKDSGDWLCKGADAILKAGGVWAGWVQNRIVPAQYFRDPEDIPSYLAGSAWLADVNNERVLKNQAYKENLSRLQNFVMVMFELDETVIPKQSSWFAEVNMTTGEVTDLQNRTMYTEDWIGLRSLGDEGKLVFAGVNATHMQLSEEDLTRFFGTYLGPLKGKKEGKEGGWKHTL